MSAPQASERTSTALVCGCNVYTMYEGGVGYTNSGLPATAETATSFAKLGKLWTNSIPCYATYGLGQ